MAHLTKKKIKGKNYYYARECQRVDGKVKTVWQKYIGTVDQMVRLKEGDMVEPAEIHLIDAGGAAALYSLAEELKITKLIDTIVPKRAQGPSFGQYMVVAAINRCLRACGKLSIPDWLNETPLPRWLKQPSELFDSQAFWNHMHKMSRENIRAIEKELAQRVTRHYKLNLRTVLYDETNYFTFIHSFNERCTLAQRGRNKQKRNDLRQIGLAVLVDSECQLPLFYDVYEGNRNDCVEFASVVDEMTERLMALREGCEGITLIMDKGHNSKENVKKLAAEGGVHFIGSLRPSDHAELLTVPFNKYTEVIDREGWKAYRTTFSVFGEMCTVIITYNDELYIAQEKVLWREIETAARKLAELQKKLDCPPARGLRRTKSGTEKNVATILKARHMKDIFTVKVYQAQNGVRMKYQIKHSAAQKLQKQLFGKTILFTDQHDWPTKDIVGSYHAQYKIEDVFRLSKNARGVSWFPMHHWTDHNIRVHAFYCMIGLLLAGALRIKLREANIDMSLERSLRHLQGIREVAQIYPNGQHRLTTNTVTQIQKKLYNALGLKDWLPPLLGTTH